MTQPTVGITIAGGDVSSDFISLKTEQDICRLAQTCEVTLNATSGTHAYDPWDTLVIVINGTNRLTGYVTDAEKTMDGTYIIRGMDKMKLAIETFLDEEVRVEEELDAGYWIDYWLKEVGITTSGSVATGRTVPMTLPDETGWQYVNVSDIILECLGYAGGGYAVIVDSDGVAQITEKTTGAGGHTFASGDNLLKLSRSQDDSWYRDRAVVFGTTSGSWVDGTWIPGEFTVVAEAGSGNRTAVLSSNQIQSQASAEDLADDILNFFDEYLDVKRCLIVGDESVWLGDGATVSEGWSGYNGTGLVTSIETTVDDAGFRQLVSLDEKCGFIWGYGKPYGQIWFAMPETLTTGDIGLWFICDIPGGITMLNTYGAVKTPSDGASIQTQIQTSPDGIIWTTQHTNVIADGYRLSGKQIGFTQAFVEQGTLVRANISQVGSTTAGDTLSVSVGMKIGEV